MEFQEFIAELLRTLRDLVRTLCGPCADLVWTLQDLVLTLCGPCAYHEGILCGPH